MAPGFVPMLFDAAPIGEAHLQLATTRESVRVATSGDHRLIALHCCETTSRPHHVVHMHHITDTVRWASGQFLAAKHRKQAM